jgi:glutathione synthase/RimK-type ligase-like ATP-grasp enzyme/gamma-glutamyl:cysteine ligase YbdK (ATP-grasp superfamily)
MPKPSPLIVVSHRREVAEVGLDAITADDYLAGEGDILARNRTVVNLCRSWRYLSKGYYVSLLADARGQDAIPTVDTIEALAHPETVFRRLKEAGVPTVDLIEMRGRRRALPEAIVAVEGGEAVPLLRETVGDAVVYRPALEAELSSFVAYMGVTSDRRFRRLAAAVYRNFPAPVLRVRLLRESDRWNVIEVLPVRVAKLSPEDRGELAEVVRKLSGRPRVRPEASRETLSIAVLWTERDPRAPSAEDTIDRFRQVGSRLGLSVHRIDTDDLGRLGDYDALFIRCLTGIEQPAFRFALRAEALGIPVIDDSRSIIRCGNKVFLHELLSREGVPVPATAIATRDTTFEELSSELGLPFVLKLPDGSFSSAVAKVKRADEYIERARAFFASSPLLIAQAYTPTDYDWRVTVLEGKVLFTCKYHMARGHWQIIANSAHGLRNGRVEAVPRERAPRDVVRVALRAAELMGNGLYGVDVKDTPAGAVVIEVNDNPNVDVGYEDAAEGDAVYEEILGSLARRVKRAVNASAEPTPAPPVRAVEGLRAPIGRVPKPPSRGYRRFEVCGLELEYPIVDRDLHVASLVEPALAALAGRPASTATCGVVGYSNEIVDHVLEIKTEVPLRSLAETEDVLVEGVRRVGGLLAERFDARLLPTGMHPWFDPVRANVWRRANRKIYDTYERLFDVRSHGWANVQATHVNLPLGRDELDAVTMMNAAALLVPYLPALAASTPMYDRKLGPAVDNRLAYLIEHQARIPESCGDMVPEYIDSLRGYRRDVLGPMYAAVDRLEDAGALRHDFLNARGAVFKLGRESMEVRVLDTQECVKMDVSIAAFVRCALRALADRLRAGALPLPERARLIEDFRATVRDGTRARVHAPHLGGAGPVRDALAAAFDMAREVARSEEGPMLYRVEQIAERGTLSERMAAVLRARSRTDTELANVARRLYIRLSECLLDNEPWSGEL